MRLDTDISAVDWMERPEWAFDGLLGETEGVLPTPEDVVNDAGVIPGHVLVDTEWCHASHQLGWMSPHIEWQHEEFRVEADPFPGIGEYDYEREPEPGDWDYVSPVDLAELIAYMRALFSVRLDAISDEYAAGVLCLPREDSDAD